jgi:hypothetical protein
MDTTEIRGHSISEARRKKVTPLIDFLWDELIHSIHIRDNAWDIKAKQWERITRLLLNESWH